MNPDQIKVEEGESGVSTSKAKSGNDYVHFSWLREFKDQLNKLILSLGKDDYFRLLKKFEGKLSIEAVKLRNKPKRATNFCKLIKPLIGTLKLLPSSAEWDSTTVEKIYPWLSLILTHFVNLTNISSMREHKHANIVASSLYVYVKMILDGSEDWEESVLDTILCSTLVDDVAQSNSIGFFIFSKIVEEQDVYTNDKETFFMFLAILKLFRESESTSKISLKALSKLQDPPKEFRGFLQTELKTKFPANTFAWKTVLDKIMPLTVIKYSKDRLQRKTSSAHKDSDESDDTSEGEDRQTMKRKRFFILDTVGGNSFDSEDASSMFSAAKTENNDISVVDEFYTDEEEGYTSIRTSDDEEQNAASFYAEANHLQNASSPSPSENSEDDADKRALLSEAWKDNDGASEDKTSSDEDESERVDPHKQSSPNRSLGRRSISPLKNTQGEQTGSIASPEKNMPRSSRMTPEASPERNTPRSSRMTPKSSSFQFQFIDLDDEEKIGEDKSKQSQKELKGFFLDTVGADVDILNNEEVISAVEGEENDNRVTQESENSKEDGDGDGDSDLQVLEVDPSTLVGRDDDSLPERDEESSDSDADHFQNSSSSLEDSEDDDDRDMTHPVRMVKIEKNDMQKESSPTPTSSSLSISKTVSSPKDAQTQKEVAIVPASPKTRSEQRAVNQPESMSLAQESGRQRRSNPVVVLERTSRTTRATRTTPLPLTAKNLSQVEPSSTPTNPQASEKPTISDVKEKGAGRPKRTADTLQPARVTRSRTSSVSSVLSVSSTRSAATTKSHDDEKEKPPMEKKARASVSTTISNRRGRPAPPTERSLRPRRSAL